MDEIIEKLEHGLMVCAVTETSSVYISQEDAEKIIARLKEQFEIVRCKDCEHLEHLKHLDEINEKECYVCRKHTFTGMRSPDWFCADGERR